VVGDAFRFSFVDPPFILFQPRSTNVAPGQTAAFSVYAGGTALRYQWQFKGTNISGATNAAYIISSAQLANAGNYRVILSNDTGNYPSDTAILSVGTVPSALGSAGRLPDGRFQFLLAGPAGNYAFDASTNLVNWIVLTNINSSNGSVQFIDDSSTNYPHRFYRVRQTP
jgi:hypothetical protein